MPMIDPARTSVNDKSEAIRKASDLSLNERILSRSEPTRTIADLSERGHLPPPNDLWHEGN
jgi:hypothetical protein